MPTTLPTPGWYPDPASPVDGERWWDGQGWTDAVRAASTVADHRLLPGTHGAPTAPAGGGSNGWGTPPPGESGPGRNAPAGPHPAGPHPAGPYGGAPHPGGPHPGSPYWSAVAPGRPGAPAGAPPEVDGGPGGRIPARAVWWGVLGIAAGEVVGSMLALLLVAATGLKVTSAGPELVGELGLWSGMLGAVVFVGRRYGSGSLRRDFTFAFRWIDLAYGLGAAVAGLAIAQIVAVAFAGSRLAGSNTQILSGQQGNTVGIVLVTLIAAVGAPFFEELFFRGLLRTALAARFGRHGAVWGQAVLFGFAHYGEAHGLGNVSVVLALILLGVVLGYTAMLTGRLGAGIVAHSLFNLTAAVTIFVVR